MPLAPSTRLGPYEVMAPLGAGGMGEVYRARDTRLSREVAVKVLPEGFAADEQRRARFEREARAISQLNHPHICTLHDVGQESGTHYLVMELLEGDSLADRLAKGPLPADQVLRFGAQVADALDCAHKRGVVHRDLKPANVVLTRAGAKLLDFGLARPTAGFEAQSSDSDLVTTARPLTEQGTLVGTFQYMAPEQLEGREADPRTDIFALGALLHEMATGQRAFAGKSRTSLIAAIVSSQPPPVSSVTAMCPPALDHVVRKCLEKDPEDRWQSAHDVAGELRWILEAGSQAGVSSTVTVRRRTREGLAWGAAASALAAAAWFGMTRPRPGPAPAPVRTSILLPEKVSPKYAVLSPDGQRIVFSGVDAAGKIQLWLRPLDAYAATPLPGTEGGALPFWSPDSQNVGFVADQKLKRVGVTGGAPVKLYEDDVDVVGGAWAPGGDILYAPPAGPVYRIPPGGGKAEPVTTLDASRHETSHRYPFFLPDGRHFLYLALNVAGGARDPANRIWVASLDGGAARPLVATNFSAQYADGHLLFIRGGALGGSLFVQPFDAARLETTSEAVPLADQISVSGDYRGLASSSVSRAGSVLYNGTQLLTRLEWFDRAGRPAGTFGEPGLHFSPRISPDGRRIAFDKYDPSTQTTQVWLGDLVRGVQSRLTSGAGSNSGAVWSADGSRVAFQSDRRHQADVYLRQVGGAGDEALSDEDGQKIPTDWSPDGRFIVVLDREPGGNRQQRISAIPAAGQDKTVGVLPRMSGAVTGGRLSPDGRWLAYASDESGRSEVFVASFPEGRGRVQISNAGGSEPRWARAGREVLYSGFDGTITSVAVEARQGLEAGPPRVLFPLPEGTGQDWDVTADGERFLLNVPVTKSSAVPLSLVFNATAGLKK